MLRPFQMWETHRRKRFASTPPGNPGGRDSCHCPGRNLRDCFCDVF